MKFENTEVMNFKAALRGMRNPMNSWDKSDSDFSDDCYKEKYFPTEGASDECPDCPNFDGWDRPCIPYIGPADMELAQRLIKGGSEHRKFMRQIFVSVDITAGRQWWSEYDTYKVGTVANSTSTMHKLAATPIDIECFEIDDFCPNLDVYEDDEGWHHSIGGEVNSWLYVLEKLRKKFLETKDKRYWYELIRWLPAGWLQTRTCTLSYENIYAMIHQRKNHKQNYWSGKDYPWLPNFVSWARTLPYAKELLFLDIDI